MHAPRAQRHNQLERRVQDKQRRLEDAQKQVRHVRQTHRRHDRMSESE